MATFDEKKREIAGHYAAAGSTQNHRLFREALKEHWELVRESDEPADDLIAALTANGRPLNTCPLNFWIACSAWARSRYSTNANPLGRPVSRSTGSTICEGGATVPKYMRRSASVVLYERLPTNKRTANQLSPKLTWKCGTSRR